MKSKDLENMVQNMDLDDLEFLKSIVNIEVDSRLNPSPFHIGDLVKQGDVKGTIGKIYRNGSVLIRCLDDPRKSINCHYSVVEATL